MMREDKYTEKWEQVFQNSHLKHECAGMNSVSMFMTERVTTISIVQIALFTKMLNGLKYRAGVTGGGKRRQNTWFSEFRYRQTGFTIADIPG